MNDPRDDISRIDPLDPNRPMVVDDPLLHQPTFKPPRRRWPGVLAAGILGVGIAAVALSSFYGPHELAQRPADEKAPVAAATGIDPAVAPPAGFAQRDAAAVDADVSSAVRTALAADPALATAPIDVIAQEGVVTLKGPAPDAQAKQRAETLAMASPGVSRVENQLTVGATTTQ